MNQSTESLNRAINVLAILTVVLMVTNFLFGLPVIFKAAVAAMSIFTAVGSAYVRKPLWSILMWTGIASINVLIGMELTLPAMLEMFR